MHSREIATAPVSLPAPPLASGALTRPSPPGMPERPLAGLLETLPHGQALAPGRITVTRTTIERLAIETAPPVQNLHCSEPMLSRFCRRLLMVVLGLLTPIFAFAGLMALVHADAAVAVISFFAAVVAGWGFHEARTYDA